MNVEEREEREAIIAKTKESNTEIVIGQKESAPLAPKKTDPKPAPRKSNPSWKPANLVEIPAKYKRPGTRYYCVDQRTLRLAQKLREGFKINKDIVPQMQADGLLPDQPATLQDGHAKDTSLSFRELLVLEIPEETAQKRDEHYANKNPLNEKLQEQDDSFHSETGGRTYGNIKIKKGD